MDFAKFIDQRSAAFKPLFDPPLTRGNSLTMDLSASSRKFNGLVESKLDTAIRDKLNAAGALAGVGGYLEDRSLYKDTELFQGDASRSIHIGVDVFIGSGTSVYAPLDGEVQSFANRRVNGDYGPVILLKHDLDGVEFHSLYGHLSCASLQGLNVGGVVGAGDKIGEIGSRRENGNWPPHLHFQLIRDLQGYHGDYPGVVRPDELEFFRQNCPDPTPLLLR